MESLAPAPRQYALERLRRVAAPVVQAGANGELRRRMPVRGTVEAAQSRAAFSHLEAVGRLLCGVAPLLELEHAQGKGLEAGTSVARLGDVHRMLANISHPSSPDFLNFSQGTQPLVDAAFLAQALLRAPNALWASLGSGVQADLLAALRRTRAIRPHFNNWLMFSALIEAFFCAVGEDFDAMRIDYALRQHEQWYVGDGHYGDGPQFHWDYYNSYVIQPMLLDTLDAVHARYPDWGRQRDKALKRAQRQAAILERMIAADGSFPPIGRSITYRCGAFHLLAQLALRKQLPEGLSPAQVRCALMAVVEKTLASDDNYDADGWLEIGLNGRQPSLGEAYVSTGSLYLCATAFLPLGLDAADPFWCDADRAWTQRQLWWLAADLPADRHLA